MIFLLAHTAGTSSSANAAATAATGITGANLVAVGVVFDEAIGTLAVCSKR
jgi:hypothetical protein